MCCHLAYVMHQLHSNPSHTALSTLQQHGNEDEDTSCLDMEETNFIRMCLHNRALSLSKLGKDARKKGNIPFWIHLDSLLD